ncbi:MAG: EipA family protein [Pseudomonadota bacterium]
MFKRMVLGLAGAMALAVSGAAQAQMRTVDPNGASDLAAVPASEANYGTQVTPPPASEPDSDPTLINPSPADTAVAPAPTRTQAAEASAGPTYEQDDVLAAAEGVFGQGAEGLAKLIEKIFAEQGKPNAYIAGREAGGAIVVGVRYGSGTLFHKVEGQLPIYWTGPSVGFDLGANGSKSFMLVYNLFDSADAFHRFPGVEGTAYIVGGFTATYLRRGDVVMIPIRLGVGWRLGVNVGYMNFTHKSKINPF